MSRKIYLDFNASTPICPEAVEAMRPWMFRGGGMWVYPVISEGGQ